MFYKVKRKFLLRLTKKVPTSALIDIIARELGKVDVSLNKELQRLNNWRLERTESEFNLVDESVHPLVLSGLVGRFSDNVRLLEFGSYTGETCAYLADSFPNLVIDTIDLPSNDPLLRSMYDRGDDSKLSEFKKLQALNLKRSNVNFQQFNTLFFGFSKFSSNSYDIIWLDAGHNYPEVAWDFSHALSVLRKGGFLVVDDVIPISAKYRNEYVSTDSWELIQYLEKRQSVKITKILKRADSHRFIDPQKRKYVVIIEL